MKNKKLQWWTHADSNNDTILTLPSIGHTDLPQEVHGLI